jgi:hypothetical protein
MGKQNSSRMEEHKVIDSKRYFTKVRQKARPPLSQKLARFLEKIEEAVIKDVRFALTGEKPPTDSGTVQIQEEDEIK